MPCLVPQPWQQPDFRGAKLLRGHAPSFSAPGPCKSEQDVEIAMATLRLQLLLPFHKGPSSLSNQADMPGQQVSGIPGICDIAQSTVARHSRVKSVVALAAFFLPTFAAT